MKNLFLLPTDKPSRLYQYLVVNPTFILSKKPLSFKTAHHIYITSDEEIKEGDWYINLLDNRIWKAEPNFINTNGIIGSKLKKIILTTDATLIEDGVQAIDDTFLEWFVKNPSCERVEVQKGFADGSNYGFNFLDYKIIIPKEEPKQETLEDLLNKKANQSSTVDLDAYANGLDDGAKWQAEQILEFLYSEITERRDYSASKMCEKVVEFIEQFKNK
jgi:hypothetical protein